MSKTVTYEGNKMPSELMELLLLAAEQGFTVQASSQGGRKQAGMKVLPPDKSLRPITFGVSEVTPAHIGNIRSSLVRAGLQLAPEVIDLTIPEETPVSNPLPTYRDILIDPQILKGLSKGALEKIIKDTDPDSIEYQVGHVINQFQQELDIVMQRHALALVSMVIPTKDSEKLETELLETMTALDAAEKRIVKLEHQVSAMGTENKSLLSDVQINLERANKAESKLKAFRTALADD